MDTLQEVLVEGGDVGSGLVGGGVVLDEVLGAEDTAARLALTGNIGAVGNNSRVHCKRGHYGDAK